ncbi:MAG TPA: RCC1 domain-containing protein, partial [Bdellovibrionales bacterium]|nr:RCC1 domain-containing protein [Bdellovibrionales bacterium]
MNMKTFFLIAIALLLSAPIVAQMRPPAAVELAIGDRHSCARFENGKVKCWGSGTYGQHGQGSAASLGDAPNEMGDILKHVALGGDATVKKMSGGDYMNCALMSDEKLKCWGYGGSGTLATGATLSIGDGPNEMGDFLKPANL